MIIRNIAKLLLKLGSHNRKPMKVSQIANNVKLLTDLISRILVQLWLKFTFGWPKLKKPHSKVKHKNDKETEQTNCSMVLKKNYDWSSSSINQKLKCPRPKLKNSQQKKNASHWNFNSTMIEVQVWSTEVDDWSLKKLILHVQIKI